MPLETQVIKPRELNPATRKDIGPVAFAFKKVFSPLLVVLLTLSPVFASEWLSLTDSLNPRVIPMPETLTSRHVIAPSLSSMNGELFLAWTEPDTHGIQQVYIKRLVDGKRWEPVGKSLNRDRGYSSSTPSIGTNGRELFLAWTEKNADNVSQLYVKSWNGTAWENLGGSLNVTGDREAKSPMLAVLNGIPYVAWNEAGEKEWSRLFIRHWNGDSWVSDGPGFALEARHISQAPFFLFQEGTGHLVWAESDESRIFRIQYAALKGGTWERLASSLNLNPAMQAFNPALAVLKDTLYLVFQERNPSSGFSLQLRQLSHAPDGWKNENSKLIRSEAEMLNPVAAAAGDALLIAWEDRNSLGIPGIQVLFLAPDGATRKFTIPPEGPDRFQLNPLLFSERQSAYLAWKETTGGDLYQVQIRKLIP